VGRTVTAVENGTEAAEVTIESATGGRETLQADLVIGADGLRSTVRAVWDRRTPVYRGSAAFRATLPRDAAPAALRGDETGLWLGSGRHVVHYPIDSGHLINVVAVLAAPEPPEDDASFRASPVLDKARQDAAEPLRHLLAAAENWSAWPLYDLPVRRMAQGRVALLGDAAHPVLPFLAQGAALAIEDAAVLARCLADQDDAARALRRYERVRRPRGKRVQEEARRNGRTYHAGRFVAFARDRVMGALGPRRMAERYAWLYGWAPDESRP
jgi:salicylate hydroxylase